VGERYLLRRTAYVNNGLNGIQIGGNPNLTYPTVDIYDLNVSVLVPITTSPMDTVTVATGQMILVTMATTFAPLNTTGNYCGEITVLQAGTPVKFQDYFNLVDLSANEDCSC